VRVVSTVSVVTVLAAVLVVGVWTATWYDALARSRDLEREAWREVDAELRRRHDLVAVAAERLPE